MAVATEKVGARVYVTGDTYPIKDRLKEAGCKWDGDRRQWWIGSAAAERLETIVAEAAAAPPPKEDLDRLPVYAKAEHNGRTFYVVAKSRDGSKFRLVSLDGQVDFWADEPRVLIHKTYQPQRRGYGRRQREEYQTLGGLRRFIESQRNPATRTGTCFECGSRGPAGKPCRDCGGEGSYV